MRDIHQPGQMSLSSLISSLKQGRFQIPDFQREFEWGPKNILELAKSIFQDYYIGSLLLWRGTPQNFDALSCEPIYGFTGSSEPTYIVLDGQQRLTAMFYAFTAPDEPAPNRRSRYLYFLRVDRFMKEDYEEAFEYDWTRRGVAILADRQRQYQEHMFPLSMVGDIWNLPYWVQGYHDYWLAVADEADCIGDQGKVAEARMHAENAEGFKEHLKGITEDYQIAYIALDRELEIDKVCDIFTKINSQGLRLDAFDLINALVKPKGVQLKMMAREAEPRLHSIGSNRTDVYVLQVMSILCQEYCSPKYLYNLIPGRARRVRNQDGSLRTDVLIADAQDFSRRWALAVQSLEDAGSLLSHPQEYGAISPKYLPYTSILPAFAALTTKINGLPATLKLSAGRKLRSWYWASVFAQRYSSAVESTTREDYIQVQRWFDDNNAEPSAIRDFHNTVDDLYLVDETQSGSAVYNGVFSLLVLQGARDWITGMAPQHQNLDDHHIIPRSWGINNDLHYEINSILNRTPLTQETNRKVIRDRLPKTYLRELIQDNGEAKVRSIMASHYISDKAFDILLRDPFRVEDFQAFAAERERTLVEVIKNLLV